MPNPNNLIQISNIVLTDTFNTWYGRTNEIIDALNPLQIYDINLGTTSGLTGLYHSNGILDLNVSPGPGIGVNSISGGSKTYIDFANFSDYNQVLSTNPDSNDEYIVNDISDTDLVRPEGKAKSVIARRMLPPLVEFSVPFQISGNVQILGNLSVLGANTFISNNNLRVSDKQIEIAYQEAVPLTLTGVSASTFAIGATGLTAYHFVNSTTSAYDIYGNLQSFTAGNAGPTGIAVIGYPFGASDNIDADNFVGITGYLSLSITGTPRYLVVTSGAKVTSFLSDENLDEGGVVLKGASGDKEWLWIYTDNDSGKVYNAWASNTNIAVRNDNHAVISRNFKSFGYTASASEAQFIFSAQNDQSGPISLYLTQLDSGGTGQQTWRMSKTVSAVSLANTLNLGYGTTFGGVSDYIRITPGASGTTFAGVSTTNFASGLNVDQLDGAHGLTSSSAYSIAIADAYGRINGEWLNPYAIRQRFTQTNHGLTNGEIVRISATGAFVKAQADTDSNAETFGMVSEVHTNSTFTVTLQGYVTGLSAGYIVADTGRFITGSAYFLSSRTPGKLIEDDDLAGTGLSAGSISKPMFLATGLSSGYVLDYRGVYKAIPTTDLVYAGSIVPIGTVYPYAGSTLYIPEQWLLCNGQRYLSGDYSDLYNVISSTYYAEAQGITSSGNYYTMDLAGGSDRNIIFGYNESGATSDANGGDIFTIVSADGNTATAKANQILNSRAGRIKFLVTAGTISFAVGSSYKVIPSTNSSGAGIFFVPDLRSRVAMGGNTGSGYLSATGGNHYVGNVGGSEDTTLNIKNIPPHTHSGKTDYGAAGTDLESVVQPGFSPGSMDYETGSTGGIGGTAQSFTNLSPYTTMHYIIRATKTIEALILTGHNHDNIYVNYTTDPALQVLSATQQQYVRTKIGALGASASDDFVNVSGDTMSGTLFINGAGLHVYSRTGHYSDFNLGTGNSYFYISHGTTSSKNKDGLGFEHFAYSPVSQLPASSNPDSGTILSIFRGDVYIAHDGFTANSGGSSLTSDTTNAPFAYHSKYGKLKLYGGNGNAPSITFGDSGGYVRNVRDPQLAKDVIPLLFGDNRYFNITGDTVIGQSRFAAGVTFDGAVTFAGPTKFVDNTTIIDNFTYFGQNGSSADFKFDRSFKIAGRAGSTGYIDIQAPDYLNLSTKNGGGSVYLGAGNGFVVINDCALVAEQSFYVKNLPNTNLFGMTANGTIINATDTNQIRALTGSPASEGNHSLTQLLIRGDMRIYGDGLSSGTAGGYNHVVPLDQYCFSVDPISNTVTIRGDYLSINGEGNATVYSPPPILQFLGATGVTLNSLTASTNPRGIIRGLTSPSSHHEASNKYYVDSKTFGGATNSDFIDLDFSYINYGSTLPDITDYPGLSGTDSGLLLTAGQSSAFTNLKPGMWYISVVLHPEVASQTSSPGKTVVGIIPTGGQASYKGMLDTAGSESATFNFIVRLLDISGIGTFVLDVPLMQGNSNPPYVVGSITAYRLGN